MQQQQWWYICSRLLLLLPMASSFGLMPFAATSCFIARRTIGTSSASYDRPGWWWVRSSRAFAASGNNNIIAVHHKNTNRNKKCLAVAVGMVYSSPSAAAASISSPPLSLTPPPSSSPVNSSATTHATPQTPPTVERTMYTIDFCPPTDPVKLRRTVAKHAATLDCYLASKPIAAHTAHAYSQLKAQLLRQQQTNANHDTFHDSMASHPHPSATTTTNITTTHSIILDSGCGTGRSSLLLGRRYPNHTVVGVDRSLARLSKTTTKTNDKQRRQQTRDNDAWMPRTSPRIHNAIVPDAFFNDGSDPKKNTDRSSRSSLEKNDTAVLPAGVAGEGELVQRVASNVWLVRAELTDFWRLLIQDNNNTTSNSINNEDDDEDSKSGLLRLVVLKHYLLYPNPYPKPMRLKQRWYAHPAFPLLFQLTPKEVQSKTVVRSNWELYLNEFATAATVQHGVDNSNEIATPAVPATSNLEALRAGLVSPEDSNMVIHGPKRIVPDKDITKAWTNFEEKYWAVGERTYELVIETGKSKVSDDNRIST